MYLLQGAECSKKKKKKKKKKEKKKKITKAMARVWGE